MKILIISAILLIQIGCGSMANSSKIGTNLNISSDSLFISKDNMSAAWYNIEDPVNRSFKEESGNFIFDVDPKLNGIDEHATSFPAEQVPDGNIKLVAIPYAKVPADEYLKYQYIAGVQVLLLNSSGDTLYLRPQDNSIIMIQEAKDKNGIWKPIEYWQNSWCGNSYMTQQTVAPGTYISVNAPRYKGTFTTEIRFRFRTNLTGHGTNYVIYSNSFTGSVNPGQFEKPADGHMVDYLN